MNFLDIQNVIDDENITGIEFTKNGFKVNFQKHYRKSLDELIAIRNEKNPNRRYNIGDAWSSLPKDTLSVSYIMTLNCESKIQLICKLTIRNNVHSNIFNVGIQPIPLYVYTIDKEIPTSTEVNLYIGKLNELSQRISEMKLQTKIATINGINQLIADYGFDFTMNTV